MFRNLARPAILAAAILAANSFAAAAQSTAPAVDLPAHRTLEYGPFIQGGSGVGERDDFQFFAVGFQAGRNLTPILHAGPLTGRFEFGVNIQPFWQAYTPAAHNEVVTTGAEPFEARIGGGTYTGFSVTPVVFRWNFMPASRKVMPWVQAAGGVIYTTHKFPGVIEVEKGTPGGTSVFNFSPQGGAGIHYFVKPRRSFDIALNAEHISSASLGDRNPGVNASVQLQLGYTWWK